MLLYRQTLDLPALFIVIAPIFSVMSVDSNGIGRSTHHPLDVTSTRRVKGYILRAEAEQVAK